MTETIADVLINSGICKTKNEVRRLIKQGAITFYANTIPTERVQSAEAERKEGMGISGENGNGGGVLPESRE